MSDVYEHNLGDHEDPLTGPTWIIGFVGAVLLAVIMLGLTALTYNAQREEDKVKVLQRDPEELNNLKNSQMARITAAPRYVEEWVKVEGQNEEQKAKSVVIPIDRAMELVAQEAGRGGPR